MGAGEGKSKRTKNEKEELSEIEIKEEKKQLDKHADWLSKQEHEHKILILMTYPHNIYIPIEVRLKTHHEKIKSKKIEFEHIPWTQFNYVKNNYFKNKLKTNSDFREGKNGFLINELKNYMEGD